MFCALLLALHGCAVDRAPMAGGDAGTTEDGGTSADGGCSGTACGLSLGSACARNGDCSSGVCAQMTDGRTICSENCNDARACLAGWTCSSNSCRCTVSTEICDGLDNDCNGVVDDPAVTNPWCLTELGPRHTCAGGACAGASCAATTDCLADEICSPRTMTCEAMDGGTNPPPDGGPVDAGVDGGVTDGGVTDGGVTDGGVTDGGVTDGGVTDGGTSPDGGADGGTIPDGGPMQCSNRCDCPYGSKCLSGSCVAISIGASCAQDVHCGRGQTCNVLSNRCQAGCIDTCDCAAPTTCSMTSFQCEQCSASHPCPSGQYCSGRGAAAQCLSNSCGTSANCNGASPGTLCIDNVCANCTQDSQCQSAPYGGGYVCRAGLCQTGCNVSQCQSVCGQQGQTCNTVACQCETPGCTDQNCGSVACSGSEVCDSNCTCVPADCTTQGCSNGLTCVSSVPDVAGCGGGTSSCSIDCALNTCPAGWDCVDLSPSQCTQYGLTSGQFCAKECASDADCPNGQPCCSSGEGYQVCSAFGSCITM